jgi:hypothetical protein
MLLSFDDITGPKLLVDEEANAFLFPKLQSPALVSGSGKADEVAAQVMEHEQVWYLSSGKLSMHQLLEALIKQTGPAAVWLSSWGITEDPARVLARLRHSQSITRLTCLFNSRVASNNAGAYQLMSQVADKLGTAECHAKAISIINPTHAIGLVSTANFSHNPRMECTIVHNNKETALWIARWIEQALQ